MVAVVAVLVVIWSLVYAVRTPERGGCCLVLLIELDMARHCTVVVVSASLSMTAGVFITYSYLSESRQYSSNCWSWYPYEWHCGIGALYEYRSCRRTGAPGTLVHTPVAVLAAVLAVAVAVAVVLMLPLWQSYYRVHATTTSHWWQDSANAGQRLRLLVCTSQSPEGLLACKSCKRAHFTRSCAGHSQRLARLPGAAVQLQGASGSEGAPAMR